MAHDALLDVTNDRASEPHEMIVARLDDGADAQDVTDALDAGEPLPATAVDGSQGIPPGATTQVRLDLEPGAYVVICAIPSPDGVPPPRQGMVEEVTVT